MIIIAKYNGSFYTARGHLIQLLAQINPVAQNHVTKSCYLLTYCTSYRVTELQLQGTCLNTPTNVLTVLVGPLYKSIYSSFSQTFLFKTSNICFYHLALEADAALESDEVDETNEVLDRTSLSVVASPSLTKVEARLVPSSSSNFTCRWCSTLKTEN